MRNESFPARRAFGCEFNNFKRKKEGRKWAAAKKKKKKKKGDNSQGSCSST